MGEMIPATPKQVEAFEKKNAQNTILPDLLSNPLAMLERGHIRPAQPEKTESNTTVTDYKMAARNLKKLSPETLRKMEEDRNKFLEALNKKSKQ